MSTFVSLHRVQRLLAVPLRTWLRLRVEGAAQVPAQGPVLLAPNHRSLLDHFMVAAASPRTVYFLGKQELARGLVGRLYLAMGMVPIARGEADREALDAVERLLTAGEAVVVFGEGTRSPTGELFRFRSGITRLASATGAPVVPIGLLGADAIWPRGRSRPVRRPRPGELTVRFGAPLAAAGEGGAERRAFGERLWHEVGALCGQPLADRFAPVEQDMAHGHPVAGETP